MKIQKQPNKWSCLPTAFAMAMDMPLTKIIEEIGHDGSEIIWPQYREPYKRRAFHIQELIMVAFKNGYSVTPFCGRVSSLPRPEANAVYEIDIDIEDIIKSNQGVLTGKILGILGHAVAWDGQRCWDSSNLNIQNIDDFEIDTFWLIIKSKSVEKILDKIA